MNWSLQHTTGQSVNLTDVQFIDSLTGWAIGILSLAHLNLYRTTNGGLQWTLHYFPITYPFSISFITRDTGWICGITINKTTNSGLSWTQQFSIDPHFFAYIQFINQNTGWAISDGFSVGRAVYKTTNGGQFWFLQSDMPFWVLHFVNEFNGWATKESRLYNTTDGGGIWTLQATYPNDLHGIFFIDQNNGWIVGNNGTILHTTNGGVTPVELISFTAGVENDNVNLNWSTGFETNNAGFEIQRSQTSSPLRMSGWEKIGFVSSKGTSTEQQFYSYTDKNLLAGEYLYRLKQIDFDGSFEYSNIVDVHIAVPGEFYLSQNYPNPFNPATKIKYSVPDAGVRTAVSLRIYDMLGREIITLVNEEKQPGVHEVDFNGTNLSSGVYYYKLQTDDFVDVKKMTLTK